MAGVLVGHLEKVCLVTALGDMERDFALALGGEPALQRIGVLQLAGNINLPWQIGCLVVVATQETSDQLVFGNIETFVEDVFDRTNNAPLAQHKDACTSNGFLAPKAEDIHIDWRAQHDLLAVVEATNRF